MHSQQSTFAVIVSAETFELLNAAGVTVGRLAAIAASFAFVGGSGLEMLHLDSTVQDSALAWTQSNPDGTGQQVTLRGPSDIGVTDPPTVLLDVTPTTSRARLRAGRKAASPAVASIDTTTTDAGNATVSLTSTAGSFASTLVSVEANATGNAGTANAKIDGYTGEAFLNAAGAGDASLRVGTIRRVRAVGGDIGLYPSASGRVYFNASPVRVENGEATSVLAGSVSVGFRSFIGPAIQANLEIGDLVEVTASARILAVAGGAGTGCVCELQVFGPLNNLVSAQRLVAEAMPNFMSVNVGGAWNVPATAFFGTGLYTFALVGGTTAGAYTFVAPDTWMTLKRFTQRGYA